MCLGKSGHIILRRDDGPPTGGEVTDAILPRKASKHNLYKTVPQTDTGRWVENTKALERTRMKELGKMVP